MKSRKCFVFVFNEFADWESALVTVALQKFTDFEVATVSADNDPVKSMGNITVVPDTTLDNLSASDVDLLILPGGFAWDHGGNREIIPLLNDMLDLGKPVAAICGAT